MGKLTHAKFQTIIFKKKNTCCICEMIYFAVMNIFADNCKKHIRFLKQED